MEGHDKARSSPLSNSNTYRKQGEGNEELSIDISGNDHALKRNKKCSSMQKDFLQNNSAKKYLQPDGQKLQDPVIPGNYSDMARGTARNATFKNFPHRLLINKIIDSGYFYTGEGDRTMCHKCYVIIYDWNEKDNPALYHEPSCEYYRNEEPMHEDLHPSLEGTSLLDTPVTEMSSTIGSVPAILTPTPAPLGVPANSGIEIMQSISMVPKEYGEPTSSGHRSLPIFETNMQSIETLEPPGNKKSVVMKPNPAIDISSSDVVVESYKKLLRNLNLCSEEDRRRTFLFESAWKRNTNNIVSSRALAASGFFYLGNLDRTRCFSCVKVFRGWKRGDRVNAVHKVFAPDCKMVRGTEAQNISIASFQSSLNATAFSSQEPSLKLPATSAAASTSLSTSMTDPSESSLQISSAFSVLPRQFGIAPRSRSLQAASSSEAELLDLTGKLPPRRPDLTEIQNNPQVHDTDIAMTVTPQDANIGDHFPIQVSGNNESEQQPMDDVITPVDPAFVLPSVHGVPETSAVPLPPQSLMVFSPVVPPPVRGEWAEVFPCDNPENPEMRSTIGRQDTFDYRWTQRGIDNTAEIARAGFYATGFGDETKCWYCGGGAHYWNCHDDPWMEHAKLYPNCEYLLQHKGPDYVADISSRRPPSPPVPYQRHMVYVARSPLPSSDEDESPYSSMEVPGLVRHTVYGSSFGGRRQSSPPRVVDPREEAARQKRMLDAALDSDLVLRAVEMGFEMRAVRRAVKRKIRSTDSTFANSEALLEALLNPPQESSSSSSDDDEPRTRNIPGTSTTIPPTNAPAPGGSRGGDQPSSSMEGIEKPLDHEQLDKKMRGYEQEKRCKVCLDRDAEVVFVPCGHLCTCTQCAGVLRTCPLCRKRIQKSLKIYTS